MPMPNMPSPMQFNSIFFGTEIMFTILIVIFCFLVYFKTKEIYNLTKHKGIQFFRYAFAFFGLAYASRLFLFLIMFSTDTSFRPFMSRMSLMPVSNLIVAFLSTMAILYLTYSTLWKKVNTEHFLTLSNIVALFVAVIAFILRSPLTLSLIQLVLMVAAGIIIFANHKKEKRKFTTKALYLMIFVFWTFSLLVLHSRHFIPFEIKVVLQVISIAVFVAIYLKVRKWTK